MAVSGRLLQAEDSLRKVEVDSAGIEPQTSQRHRSDLPLSYGCCCIGYLMKTEELKYKEAFDKKKANHWSKSWLCEATSTF